MTKKTAFYTLLTALCVMLSSDLCLAGEKGKETQPTKKGKGAPVAELKVHARGAWPWTTANPNNREKPLRMVLRSAAEVVAATPLKNLDAPQDVVEKDANSSLAKAFKVEEIDWTKHMIVVVSTGTLPTGGVKIEIVNVQAAEGTLFVQWKSNTPQLGTDAFSHPSQAVLVDRAEGKPQFMGYQESTKAGPKRVTPVGPAGPPPGSDKKGAEATGEKSQMKIHAKAPVRAAGMTSVIIKSADELAKLAGDDNPAKASGELALTLKVDKIDWTKQMVVVVSGGVQRTGGYSVDVKEVVAIDKKLTVRWQLNTPAPGSIVTQALTHPGMTILIDRFDGMVEFDPPPPKGKRLR